MSRQVNAGNKNTHPACTIHEDEMWLPQWLDSKWSHTQKISPTTVNPRDIGGEHRRRRRPSHPILCTWQVILLVAEHSSWLTATHTAHDSVNVAQHTHTLFILWWSIKHIQITVPSRQFYGKQQKTATVAHLSEFHRKQPTDAYLGCCHQTCIKKANGPYTQIPHI